MISEVADQFKLLQTLHMTIDKSLEGLSNEDWVRKPGESFNNIASVIDHVMLVEQKFLTAVAGHPADIDTQEPFQANAWDVAKIKEKWSKIIDDTKVVLETINEGMLEEPGLKLSIGELNKRQLLSYMLVHTAHHRGQIPLIKRLLTH